MIKTKIAFRCDLKKNIGLGHVSRMLVLAKEFKKNNYECFFIFNSNQKKLVKSYFTKYKVIYHSSNVDHLGTIKLVKKFKIQTLVVDSYLLGYNWEKEIVKQKILLISVDDHIRKHASQIVISNRPRNKTGLIRKKNQIWLSGIKYALIERKNIKKDNRINKKIKILLHAGGSSLFQLMKELTITTLELSNNRNVDIKVLCTTKKSTIMIKKIIKNLKIGKKIIISNYIKDLKSKLKNFDIVVGPAGTTTFETIISRSLPVTVPIVNDGRESLETWRSLGHFLHIENKNKRNKKILRSKWQMVFKNYDKLLYDLVKKSRQLDGLGASRIFKYINHSKKNLN